MNTPSVKLYSYSFSMAKTYLFAAAFVAGNVILPYLAHQFTVFGNNGGLVFLPIYFFTLIGSYKYGLKVGLLTAILSPAINFLPFGMAAYMPVVLVKSVLLAIAVAATAKYFKKVSLIGILLAIVAYQVLGGFFEWAITGSFIAALQDIKIGFPGLVVQFFGGFALLKAIEKV